MISPFNPIPLKPISVLMTHDLSPSELHLLYVLLDSNLPTGGFVSSSGLESFAKHGFLARTPNYDDITHALDGTTNTLNLKRGAVDGVLGFASAEIENYGVMTLGFVCDAWKAMDAFIRGNGSGKCPCGSGSEKSTERAVEVETSLEDVMRDIVALDQYHEATSLSHVARRSSRAQGVAMLTLYVRGLHNTNDDTLENTRSRTLIDEYKRLIRKGDTPGHLAVCWGVVAAALGLKLDRATHLHLFLHARSLLSSAVRLNLIGPYISSQLLLHPFKPLINPSPSSRKALTTRILSCRCSDTIAKPDQDPWAWAEEAETGPATTWPLGEVLMGRHDMQHSRIFNS